MLSINRILLLFFLILFLLPTTSCDKKIPPIEPPNPVLKAPFTKAFDILWASPKGFNLTMDIYTPTTGKASYPVIIMFHGGGWLINNKNIMTQSAAYLATNGEYVVCNVNYRLLGDLNNTVKMNEIVEDVFGAVLWVKDNISTYKGDATKVIVTGDSAGGQLSAMVTTQGQNLESDGFAGATLGFKPTYLPIGKTAEQVAQSNGLAVQAALLSYGVFDMYASALGGLETASNFFWAAGNAKPRGMFGDSINVTNQPAYYKQVSPIYTIPKSTARQLPPTLLTVGSKDNLTTPATIEAYVAKLKEAGHTNLEYWIHEGRPHAFLDGGSNAGLGISFDKDAIPALDKMLTFLNKIFYK
jgi:acetyl esterase